ncbi:MAG TPA: hypothetical protein VHV83_03155 [Armatimonadota bacterium]|nr:hypothetical protein [Armatimonadota bacterium]
MKRNFLIVIAIIVSLLAIIFVPYMSRQISHIRHTKQKLLSLACDRNATQKRVKEIRKTIGDRWTDGNIGITGDGYVFYYDLHDSHGTDAIADINIFFLPDEKRFIISYAHYCVDLSKFIQPRNKAELLKML